MGAPAQTFIELVGKAESIDEAALAATLTSVLAEVREAWPKVVVGDERFVRYLAERVAEEDDPVAALGKRVVADLYLACGCADGDGAALEGFEQSCLAQIAPAIRRIDGSAAFLDEVRQSMRVALLVAEGDRPPRIASYKGAGKLRSWVQVSAVRAALEQRRKSRPQDQRDDDELLDASASDLDDDPEIRHIKQLYRGEFKTAFAGAMRALESRERNILRMYLVDGLNIDEIGTVYRVHRATVARWIAKSRETLLTETRKRLLATLKIDEAQFDSLMVVVRSHLDLSMERLLQTQSLTQPPTRSPNSEE